MHTNTGNITEKSQNPERLHRRKLLLILAGEAVLAVILVLFVWYSVLRTRVHLYYDSQNEYKKDYTATEGIYAAPYVGDANETAGSQHDVDGLFAYLGSWQNDTFDLILESTNTQLDCILLQLEDQDGTLLGRFDNDAVLAKAPLIAESSWEASTVSFTVGSLVQAYEPSNVYLRYRYEDTDQTRCVKVYPFSQEYNDLFAQTNIRIRDNINDFPELSLQDGILTLSCDTLRLTQPLFIPEGLTFYLSAGQTVDFCNNAYIMCRSTMQVDGTQTQPVTFCSSDSSDCAAIVVLQAQSRSNVRNLVCDNLSELNVGAYHLTGAVTFYESDVDFYNCRFLNNRSEDGVNTVRSDVLFDGCTFSNTYQDAYDSDFCTGVFRGCYFEKTGNDAFDVSTSTFSLEDVTFQDIHDKAISSGERSTVNVNNITVSKAQTCIGAKDDSTVVASNVHASDVFIGFCMYQKKPEFSHSRMTINGYSLERPIDFKYLIESDDVLVVDGEQWVASGKKKQSIIIQKMINEEPIR